MNKRLSEHRKKLKRKLLDRDEYCPGCNDLLIPGVNIQMHEAFIRKSTMMGLSNDKKILLHCKENCSLLCMSCNLNEPDNLRGIIWELHCNAYSFNHMTEWYQSASDLFKSPLQKFWKS